MVIHARRTGLGVIRSLGKLGVEVYAADEYHAPGLYSRYVKKRFLFDGVANCGEEAFVQRLLEIGRVIEGKLKPVLFTGSDDYLPIIARNWEKLSEYFLSASETNEELLHKNLLKDQMYHIAEEADVKYPQTRYSRDFTDAGLRYPVVVKPSLRKSSDYDDDFCVFKIRKCADRTSLQDAIGLLRAKNIEFVVQEFIDGEDDSLFTVGLYAHKGRVLGAATARKLRQFPPVTGECSLGELVNEPGARIAADAFISFSGITGICQVEFKKHDGCYYLMEINPRPWSWNSLMEYAGVNLPFLACSASYGHLPRSPVEQKKYSGTWIFALMDLKYHVLEARDVSVSRFLLDLVLAKRHAYWGWTDPAPFLVAVLQFLAKPRVAYGGRSFG